MHKVQPRVALVNVSGSENNIYLAARRCYSESESWVDLHNSMQSPEIRKKLIRSCIKSGHTSILEHVSFTFHITCSRACSHQFVRHRIASYSQQSQRYVEVKDLPFIMPDFLYLGEKKDDAEKIMWRVSRILEDAYEGLVELGAKPEDARSVLHQATATHFVVTMNCRSLWNFFKHRCCYRAQAEIRDIANMMLDNCKLELPTVFENAGPKCLQEGRCLEHKSCGHSPWKKENEN